MKKDKKKWLKRKSISSLIKIKKCEECGISETKKKLFVHHIHPKIYGGNDERSNLMKVCGDCHIKLDFLALNHYEKGLIND